MEFDKFILQREKISIQSFFYALLTHNFPTPTLQASSPPTVVTHLQVIIYPIIGHTFLRHNNTEFNIQIKGRLDGCRSCALP